MLHKQNPSLENSVQRFFQAHPVPRGKTLLLAVSGGPDSVCLLHIVHKMHRDLGIGLHVAHLDHRLRASSADDAQYVFDLCHRLGIPVTIGQADVHAYRHTHRLTLEEAAREVRYDFLAETAQSVKAAQVALGHTQDDHLETVLLHIIRGTGIGGLRGLLPVTRWQSPGRRMTIVRPLLDVTRADTAGYCRKHRLQARLDPSNLDTGFLRNRIRLELLPQLKTMNRNFAEALSRLSFTAGSDIDYIDTTAARYYRKAVRRIGDAVQLDRRMLLKLHPSLQRAILRMAIEALIGTLKDIEARHIEDMRAHLAKPAGKTIILPYGLHLATGYNHLTLAKGDIGTAFPPLKGEQKINCPGITEIPGWTIHAHIVEPVEISPANEFTAFLDAEHISGNLMVRGRRPGDFFQPLGMGEEKKVSSFMIDAHIPKGQRLTIPILCSGGRVIWVVGYRIDERMKVTAGTKRVCKITFTKAA